MRKLIALTAVLAGFVWPATAGVRAQATPAASAVRIANFAFSPQAVTVSVGQTVTWTNADTVAHTTTSNSGIWNSGPVQPGASFSQTFTASGTYAYHCAIHSSMMGTITVVPAASTPAVTAAAASPPQPGILLVSYPPGWNLVAAPTGMILTGTDSPLYTLRAGDSGYNTVPAGSPLAAMTGYWAHFGATTTENLPITGAAPGSTSLSVPAGRFILVGDPGTAAVTLSGVDDVLSYDPAAGYHAVTTLQPGQGAWAFSISGGTLTMSPAGSASAAG
jgi:plastocyanin